MKNAFVFVAFTLLMATLNWSCSKTIDDSTLLNIKWVFTEGEHDGFIFEYVEEIYIEFSEAEATGSGGCNTYWLQYELTEDQIDVSGLTYTEKACGNGISEIENVYFDLIGKAESLEIKGNKLTIFCENGKLIFEN